MPRTNLARELWVWLDPPRQWIRLRQRPLRRLVLCLAFTVLVLGLFLSLREQRAALENLDWGYLGFVVVLPIPLVLLLSVLEYLQIGRLLGKAIPFRRGCETTIIGVAANMLPLPGSTLVRLADLKAMGVRLGDGSFASILVFSIWLAVASAYSGMALVIVQSVWLGISLALAGGLLLAMSLLAARRYPGGAGTMFLVATMRLGVAVLEAVRLYLCLEALGVPASFAQASGLTVMTVLGSAASFVPAGLGIREAVTAAFSPVVGLAMSAGFLAAAINRLLAILAVVPLALLLLLRSGTANRLNVVFPWRDRDCQSPPHAETVPPGKSRKSLS